MSRPQSLHKTSRISSPEPLSAAEAEAKRRKVQRACDVCRRKKIRCEGPMNSMATGKCANCEEFRVPCTYVEAAKRRGPPKGYIETLEHRCWRLERILQQLHPDLDIDSQVGPALDREEFDSTSYSETLKSLDIPAYPFAKALDPVHLTRSGSTSTAVASPAANVLGAAPWKNFQQDPNRPAGDDAEAREDARVHQVIADGISRLEVKEHPWRFHGKASGAQLMTVLADLKYGEHINLIDCISRGKRDTFWRMPEWEMVIANEDNGPIDWRIWPEAGLDTQVIDAYFDHVNPHLPLLNRVIFARQYASQLHHTNREFAKVCLMVFANGARFIDDPKLYWPTDVALSADGQRRLATDPDGSLRYSAGWKYFRSLLKMGKSLMHGPNLFDFQIQVLVCAFLQGSAAPHLIWLITGVGLRSAQELGIHVRSTLMNADPIERALYNRAFWCLYHIDRISCASIGRSVALQDTDFDADYPIDVDDQFWETGDPATAFKQPGHAGLPRISSFIHLLKLDHVIGGALRTIYAINRLPEHRGDTNAQRAVVVELDSALNAWADAVPMELRWDPSRPDQGLFQQSAVLYAHYYYCQILIHRPFIPTSTRASDAVGLPSLAICSNASRSICNILDASLRRGRQQVGRSGFSLHGSLMVPAWIAAVILLISIHAGTQTALERERAKADVQKCIAAMREMEVRWRLAGKLTDMLMELSSDAPTATSKAADTLSYPMTSIPDGQPAMPPPIAATNDLFDPSLFDSSLFSLGGDEDLWTQLFGGHS